MTDPMDTHGLPRHPTRMPVGAHGIPRSHPRASVIEYMAFRGLPPKASWDPTGFTVQLNMAPTRAAMGCHVICHRVLRGKQQWLLWDATSCHGMPRGAMGCHGLPRVAMGCHGLP